MKLWKRLAVLAGTTALAAGLAVPHAGASEPTPGLPLAARLACQPRIIEGKPTAVCEWRVHSAEASGVELWRGTGENGELTRVKVFSTTDSNVHRYADDTVELGKHYGYVLVVLGPEGNPRGVSNLSRVSFPRPNQYERLKLACNKTLTSVHCEWRAPEADNAAKVVLYGAVDRGARTVLTTLEPAAGGTFDLPIPAGAHVLRFALVSFDSSGEVVGRSPVLSIVVARPPRR